MEWIRKIIESILKYIDIYWEKLNLFFSYNGPVSLFIQGLNFLSVVTFIWVIVMCLYVLFVYAYTPEKYETISGKNFLLSTIKASFMFLVFLLILWYTRSTCNGWEEIIEYKYFDGGVRLCLYGAMVMIPMALLLCKDDKYTFKSNGVSLDPIVLILLTATSFSIIILTNNLFTMMIGVEILTMPVFILTCINRYKNKSLEAALKYFILGCLCTAITLFSLTILYMFVGTLELDEIARHLDSIEISERVIASRNIKPIFTDPTVIQILSYFNLQPKDYPSALCSFLNVINWLVLTGPLFKMGLVPYHTWMADTYQGINNSIFFYLLVVPKIPIVSALSKILIILVNNNLTIVYLYVLLSGVFSIIYGCVNALFTKSFKKFMVYSSIVQMGLICVCLYMLPNKTGGLIVLMFLIVYIIVNFLVLYIWINLKDHKGKHLEVLSEFTSLKGDSLILTIIFILGLLSLSGLPPLLGSFTKLIIFFNFTVYNTYCILFLLMFLSIYITVYYIKFIRIILFRKEDYIYKFLKKKTFTFYIFVFYLSIINFFSLLFFFNKFALFLIIII